MTLPEPRSVAIIFGVLCSAVSASAALSLSEPTVQSNIISFSFNSLTEQLLTVQGSTTLSGPWADVAFFRGTGGQIKFSAPTAGNQRFFRVRETAFQPLDLRPSGPTLTNEAVSLPDAEPGQTYMVDIFPGLSGVPPYSIQIGGTPPDGVSLVISNNQTANASVRVASSETGLVAGQRRQFSVTVVDGANMMRTRSYDIRVIPPPPQILTNVLALKAGESANAALAGINGTQPLSWSVVSGSFPEGTSLSVDGLLSGTPSAGAAELNENGIHRPMIQVADSLTDRVTGTPTPRRATNTVPVLVRLSYVLNIQATRDNGPSLQGTCYACHGGGFPPDFDGTALSLINVNSGSGFVCGTDRVYISPGNTTNSLIYRKLSATPPCGERMPYGGPYFTDQRLERLARWIRELTPQDTD